MTDSTAALLAEMAAYGLDPGTIVWDRKIHRFPAHGDKTRQPKGWYRAFEDKRGAFFGHLREGIKAHWYATDDERTEDMTPEELAEARREWKEQREAREAEREAEQKAAAAACGKKWDVAEPADPKHPYLVKKGITTAAGIRQSGKDLLIPVRDMHTNLITSLQTIGPDGMKLFAENGRVQGCRTTIGAGAFKKGPNAGLFYVTEGWATAWSINAAAGAACLVAFNAQNLMPVAEEARKRYPDARIIIAADNDRWTSLKRSIDGKVVEVPNPGVTLAREAAKASKGRFAIPEFTDLSEKPTDFNDLHRREGADAVVRWLDPERSSEATTLPHLHVVRDQDPPPPPPPSAGAPEPELEEPGDEVDIQPPSENGDEPQPWHKTAPFRCLGYDGGRYFYLPRGTGQIHALSASGHRRETLLTVAPASWWEHAFPARNGTSWPSAADAMFRACERVGVFRPERLRGRGCWPDEGPGGEGRVLLHLGDRLLPPGSRDFVDPESYNDHAGRIYERQPALAGPSRKRALTLEEAQSVLDLFRDLLWYEDASGLLAAGWTALAPLCGALSWRPHIWIVGDSGAGKTTVVEKLIVPMMGGMMRFFEGATTEAGARQRLGSDGLPVLFDEAEAERQDGRSDDRVQSVLALARSASSSGGAEVAKGTAGGKAQSFQIRSMFCLSSVGGALRQEADKTRVSLLQLHGKASVPTEERRAHWERYAPKLAGVSIEMGRQLVSRSLGWLRDGRLEETLRVFRGAASGQLGDARSGDQYGTLYAGAWTLMSDSPPDPMEARELLGGDDLGEYIAEQVPAGKKVLRTLLQQEARIDTKNGPRTYAVGELIDAATPGTTTALDIDAVNLFLKRNGIRVDTLDGETVVMLANTSEWVRRALRDTPYADGWIGALRTLNGVRASERAIHFHAGLNSRATIVPRGSFD